MAIKNSKEKKIASADEDIENFYRHMSSEDNLGVALRSAIYIENQIDLLVDQVSWSSQAVSRLNLDYAGKVDLALILGLDERFRPPLSCIGKIRNRFAHQIATYITKNDADGLYKSLSPQDKCIVQKIYNETRVKTANMRPRKFSSLPPLERFILIAIALRGALIIARQQAPNNNNLTST